MKGGDARCASAAWVESFLVNAWLCVLHQSVLVQLSVKSLAASVTHTLPATILSPCGKAIRHYYGALTPLPRLAAFDGSDHKSQS